MSLFLSFCNFLKTLTGSIDATSVLFWMQYNTVNSFKFVEANFRGLSILLRFVVDSELCIVKKRLHAFNISFGMSNCKIMNITPL